MHAIEPKTTPLNSLELKLKASFLTSAQNQSNVENMLPFGMKRQLNPLRVQSTDSSIVPARIAEMDCLSILKPDNYDLKQMIRESANKIKFINHKVIPTAPSSTSTTSETSSLYTIDENRLKFDPSAICFFKGKEMLKTNLTSNANGTVSNDKNYLSGVLKNQGCWMLSLPDITKFSLPDIQNNKLRAMKYLEYVTQEWDGGIDERFGNETEFIALNVEESDKYKVDKIKAWVLISKKAQEIKEMAIKVFDDSGRIKLDLDTLNLNLSNSIMRIPIIINNGDTIILTKGHCKNISFIDFDLEDDLDGKLERINLTGGLKAIIISRVHYKHEFDEIFSKRGGGVCFSSEIEHICHLDTKIGEIVKDPKPIPFGCTTRHSVIYRKGYFAALHHDASKINRFMDTINYIIRKLINPENLNKRMDQEAGLIGYGATCSYGSRLAMTSSPASTASSVMNDSVVLKRISDIQYFAYLIKCPWKNIKRGYFLGLGGGAKCVLISFNFRTFKIFEFPILIFVPEEELKLFPNIILLSPHFPTFLVKRTFSSFTGENGCDWLKNLLKISELNPQNFKLSMAHFKIKEYF